MRPSFRPSGMFSAVAVAVLGLLLVAPAPLPAKTHIDLGVGFGIGNFGVGSGSWLAFDYGRHHRSGVSWDLSLGLGSPGYVYAPPVAPVYEYCPYVYPRYSVYASPGYSISRYRRIHHREAVRRVVYRGHIGPAVYPAYRPAPAAVLYDPPAYRSRGAVTVVGGYHGRGSSVAVGVTVPIGGSHTYRTDGRIVRGRPVEQNPIMKRVWVPGQYVTTRAASPGQAPSSGSADKVWVEGYWDYVPDTQ